MKASSQADTSAGASIGTVMTEKVFTGPAPRSIAASSSDWSSEDSRARMITATKAIEKVMCAMVMVETPRCQASPTNSSNVARPVMTSGMTSGAVIMPVNNVRPLKRPNRPSA